MALMPCVDVELKKVNFTSLRATKTGVRQGGFGVSRGYLLAVLGAAVCAGDGVTAEPVAAEDVVQAIDYAAAPEAAIK